MPTLSRDDILKAQDLKIVKVQVQEWGGDVHVKRMTAGERDKFDFWVVENQKSQNIRAAVLAFTMCDEQGEALFTPEHIKDISQKDTAVIEKLFNVATELNPIFSKDVEKLEKN